MRIKVVIMQKLGGISWMVWIECRENMVRNWLVHNAKLGGENFKLQLLYSNLEILASRINRLSL